MMGSAPWRRAVPAELRPRSRWIVLTILVAFAASAAWELAQAPLFVLAAHGLFAVHVWACLLGAACDVVLLALSYLATAAAVRRLRWARRPGFPPAALLFVSIGLVATVAIERWALSTGLWSYAKTMPTFAGVGVAPIAQWVVIPVLLLWFVRRGRDRDRSSPRPSPSRESAAAQPCDFKNGAS